MVVTFNEDMDVIDSTVLKLERDATWGEKRKRIEKKMNEDGINFERSIVELDDARLFFHNGQLHVLYRNGPYYGYESKFFSIHNVFFSMRFFLFFVIFCNFFFHLFCSCFLSLFYLFIHSFPSIHSYPFLNAKLSM